MVCLYVSIGCLLIHCCPNGGPKFLAVNLCSTARKALNVPQHFLQLFKQIGVSQDIQIQVSQETALDGNDVSVAMPAVEVNERQIKRAQWPLDYSDSHIANLTADDKVALVKIKINGLLAHGLFDTGASVTLISPNFRANLSAPRQVGGQQVARSLTGHTVTALESLLVVITFGSKDYEQIVHISNFCPYDCILGMDFIRKLQLVTIDFTKKESNKDWGAAVAAQIPP